VLFKTQPTLHITEVTGGTKEGIDQLFLSDHGVERLLKIRFDEQQSIVAETLEVFFKRIHEKSILIAGKQCSRAEFYLLNEFYYHIAELNMLTPKEVSDIDLNKIKKSISDKLELGTKFKVKDLFEQVYDRLLEKKKTNTLNAKQNELIAFLEEQNSATTFKEKSPVHPR
jgi:hypothetical protein